MKTPPRRPNRHPSLREHAVARLKAEDQLAPINPPSVILQTIARRFVEDVADEPYKLPTLVRALGLAEDEARVRETATQTLAVEKAVELTSLLPASRLRCEARTHLVSARQQVWAEALATAPKIWTRLLADDLAARVTRWADDPERLEQLWSLEQWQWLLRSHGHSLTSAAAALNAQLRPRLATLEADYAAR